MAGGHSGALYRRRTSVVKSRVRLCVPVTERVVDAAAATNISPDGVPRVCLTEKDS